MRIVQVAERQVTFDPTRHIAFSPLPREEHITGGRRNQTRRKVSLFSTQAQYCHLSCVGSVTLRTVDSQYQTIPLGFDEPCATGIG